MHLKTTEDNASKHFDSERLEIQLRALIESFVNIIKKTALRNFFILMGIYLLTLLLGLLLMASLTVWLSPLLTAFSLSGFLLTIIGGYVFHRYRNLHKPDDYQAVLEKFAKACHQHLPYQPRTPERYATLGLAYAIFSDSLRDMEYAFFNIKALPKSLSYLLENLSCYFFWKDIFIIHEQLLNSSIEENLHLVKTDPVNLTYHSQLANGYVLLSRLYKNPKSEDSLDERRWIPEKRFDKNTSEKYRRATERAIEEFKIISTYAPDDPWVLAQLAFSYRDLNLPHEEIHTCEALLRLCPSDRDTLHRLGSLYFILGANAKGLEVYRQLCHIDCGMAATLIAQYGSH